MRHFFAALLTVSVVLFSCRKDKNNDPEEMVINEDPATFSEIASINIGGAGAAEISAYCEQTKRLFVVNNSSTVNRIEVINLTNPESPTITGNINLTSYNGAANSVAVHEGKLAVALESTNKQDLGKVIVFKTSDYSELKTVTVGALPDMVTFSPDGKYILSANEGEPNATYTSDPDGSVSIIDVTNNYSVRTVGFSSFNGQLSTLQTKGFRSFGPNAGNLGKDVEPEYITVSEDSKTAWVTLQENNAIAKIDLASLSISIFPLGFKSYNTTANSMDLSDQDGTISFSNQWPVSGIYMPDAIAVYTQNNIPYLFTANEGDQREYTAFNETRRIGSSSHILDATAFPNASVLKTNTHLGRLNTSVTIGDTDNDGDYDQLYSFGARSFSVWNGINGNLVFDSNNDLEKRAQAAGVYDDGRSDDKGTEPEGITYGKVGTKHVLFVGLERADAIVIYDISNPATPTFLQFVKTGDAPEGLLFIPARKAPGERSLLIVSSENDGSVKIYRPNKL